jgi:hypothetical protein
MDLIPLDAAPPPAVQLGPLAIVVVLAVIAVVVAILLLRHLRRR